MRTTRLRIRCYAGGAENVADERHEIMDSSHASHRDATHRDRLLQAGTLILLLLLDLKSSILAASRGQQQAALSLAFRRGQDESCIRRLTIPRCLLKDVLPCFIHPLALDVLFCPFWMYDIKMCEHTQGAPSHTLIDVELLMITI